MSNTVVHRERKQSISFSLRGSTIRRLETHMEVQAERSLSALVERLLLEYLDELQARRLSAFAKRGEVESEPEESEPGESEPEELL